tara:strand:+ start:780 stop:1046 length:267 start_codon:yes stop_codon:yes gene_type:complete
MESRKRFIFIEEHACMRHVLRKKWRDVNKLQVYFPGLINAGRKIKLYFVIAKIVSFTVSSPVLGWTEAPMCKFPHTYLLHVVPWEKER